MAGQIVGAGHSLSGVGAFNGGHHPPATDGSTRMRSLPLQYLQQHQEHHQHHHLLQHQHHQQHHQLQQPATLQSLRLQSQPSSPQLLALRSTFLPQSHQQTRQQPEHQHHQQALANHQLQTHAQQHQQQHHQQHQQHITSPPPQSGSSTPQTFPPSPTIQYAASSPSLLSQSNTPPTHHGGQGKDNAEGRMCMSAHASGDRQVTQTERRPPLLPSAPQRVRAAPPDHSTTRLFTHARDKTADTDRERRTAFRPPPHTHSVPSDTISTSRTKHSTRHGSTG